nr:hypothetical protein [Tanacetum cinerariifolium]
DAQHSRERAGAARNLSQGLRPRGARGPALDRDVVVQHAKRAVHLRKPRVADRYSAAGMGLQRPGNDRLVRRQAPRGPAASRQRPADAR